jgi:peptidoglycan-N-acetylglucosamine deacetylase
MDFYEESEYGSKRKNVVKFVAVAVVAILVAIGIYLLATSGGGKSSSSSAIGAQYDKNRLLHSFNWCGPRRVVSLTFDDGPHPLHTPTLLEDLNYLGIRATFYLSPAKDGDPTDQQCYLVRALLADGHDVQSHSYDHRDFVNDLKTEAERRANLERNKKWIEDCAQKDFGRDDYTRGYDLKPDVHIFRPPFGSLDKNSANEVSKFGYDIGTWNVESSDYEGFGKEITVENVKDEYFNLIRSDQEDRSVVVIMHDHMYHDGPDGTMGSLDDIVMFFEDEGYEFVTASECYNLCKERTGGVCKMADVWPGTFDV